MTLKFLIKFKKWTDWKLAGGNIVEIDLDKLGLSEKDKKELMVRYGDSDD